MSFKFNLARLPRIEFGAGRLAALPGLVAGYSRRVLIVTGSRSFLTGPHWKTLADGLRQESVAWEIVQVPGEPSPALVDQSVSACAGKGFDCVLGIGGGSALDAAKAIAIPHNREIIHTIPRGYVVDDQEGVQDPIGMQGIRLEVGTVKEPGGTPSPLNGNRASWRSKNGQNLR